MRSLLLAAVALVSYGAGPLAGEEHDRLRAIASAAAAPQASDGALFAAALADKDASVRYWAARGLGHLGWAALPYLKELEQALGDPSPSVRIAAARAWLRLGRPERSEAVLLAELESPGEWNRLLAISTLAEFPELAARHRQRLSALLTKETNDYVQRIARRLTSSQ
jgi:HEAT repeat protein